MIWTVYMYVRGQSTEYMYMRIHVALDTAAQVHVVQEAKLFVVHARTMYCTNTLCYT